MLLAETLPSVNCDLSFMVLLSDHQKSGHGYGRLVGVTSFPEWEDHILNYPSVFQGPGQQVAFMANMEQRKSSDSSIIGKVAAHVPDLIVYGDFSQEVPFIESFDGVLLFADISGG